MTQERATGSSPEAVGENLGAQETQETAAEEVHFLDDYPPEVREAAKKEKTRVEKRSGVETCLKMKSTEALTNEEIIEKTKSWTGSVGMPEENLSEVLQYFDIFESIIDEKFPPEHKAEIACALAEIVSDPATGIDAETLQALSYRITYGGKSGTMDRVCEYSLHFPSIKIYDELFVDINGTPQNVSHILQHEIGHALEIYGGAGKSEAMTQGLDQMTQDVDSLKTRESYRVINAIEQYVQTVQKEGATPQEIESVRSWLKTEIRAEKISAYLQSGGELEGFLWAVWKTLPPETARKIKIDDALRKSWIEENKVFFEEIQKDMSDKERMKQTILENSAAAMKEMDGEEFDMDMFEQSFVEPAQIDNSKSPQGQGQNGNILNDFSQLFAAVAKDIETTVPVEEIGKAA